MADGKVKAFFSDVKEHWNTPDRSKGNYVSYKEHLQIFGGVTFNYAAQVPLNYLGFGASCFLIMYHYNLPYVAFSVVGLIGLPLGYLWTLIGWLVTDNLNAMEKKTERRVVSIYGVGAVLGLLLILFDASKLIPAGSALYTLIGRIPGVSMSSFFKILGVQCLINGYGGLRNIFFRKKLLPKFGRYKYNLYANVVQKCVFIVLLGWLPIYNIPNVEERFWLAYLLFSLYGMFDFSASLQSAAYMASPNPQERLWIRAYPVKISHLLNSVFVVVIPLLGEFDDINFFRWVLPACFVPMALLTLFFARNVKERIPQPPLEKKQNISLWYGISEVTRNKFRWVNVVADLLDAFGNGMLDIITIAKLYTLRLSGLEYSLLTILYTARGTIPTFFAPIIMKKFSYRALKEFNQLTTVLAEAICILALFFTGENVTLCAIVLYVTMWLRGFVEEVTKVAQQDMSNRLGDFQMYLSGERLEGFSGVYGWFTGPLTTLIGLIIPVLMLHNGFNSNWEVLFIDSARFNILAIPLIFDMIGHLLMMIPYAFWRYNNKQHIYVMKTLEQRAKLAQAGWFPNEYTGGLHFEDPGRLDSEIPTDIDAAIEHADVLTEEELEGIKMN